MPNTVNVYKLLQTAHPDVEFVLKTEITGGDVVQDKPLAELARSNPGLFTKELEVS